MVQVTSLLELTTRNSLKCTTKTGMSCC